MDTDEQEKAITSTRDLARRGGDERAAWAEVHSLIKQRADVAAAELKHLVNSQQMLSLEKVLLVQAAFIDIIKRRVDDPETAAAIAAEMRTITDRRDP